MQPTPPAGRYLAPVTPSLTALAFELFTTAALGMIRVARPQRR